MFVAVFIGTVRLVAAVLVNQRRRGADTRHPTAALVRAAGACASCHREETGAMVAQYEQSVHHIAEVNCLQCHDVADGQEGGTIGGSRSRPG